MTLMIQGMIILILSLLMMSMSSILSKKTFQDREKSSPFECGFDPKTSARLPFSLQFFLIAVIFLVFDVEITLLIPLITIMKTMNTSNILILSTLFIMILIIGTYHEWNQGALNWAN
uniref:NADH-ubiquinone oxidoreductase chain 3 n=2 Tax=Anthrenus verbasci TaxID=295669 RepID=A0A5H2VDB9_9COLE|nr:NADH dehydrogenase subunit 3 [Anthrenus museorum]UQJ73828.1 NADH dehydrogenase subunit 3 [Anthrenus museorum]BBE06954.1 NADH dehydrogenase subunit 3 [Anthrenus verbasci]